MEMNTLDELEKLLAEHERLHDDLANHAEGSFEQVAAADRCHAIRYEFQSALLANSVELLASARRVERLEALVRDMIENEPDDLVSDGGHTVLDLWRHDARAAFTRAQGESS
jgi:predicted metal-dependent hydrolase